ncbi:hypothetical protein ACIG0C_20600 [Kitasatospora aureofaciens]|uniref:Uncharacterized protein n=2 Tax=Kitasatospora aureofaciens TaxID=1894 RepID=A0A8H9LH54_KITAU|nr:hypothetical protein [Kitasatospora aureofaciens]UKZ08139.1 hypothetical protein BOQ63_029790 [Streptomyces viridifaciens]GGU59257.1 hypothetical protein GCM10010502_07000 [Kitasatospora aureofaciens]HJD84259.1 hypothetical protein [Kitasatospora aureofaciens]
MDSVRGWGMGALAFVAGLVLFVMGMGKWQETGTVYWLWGSLAFLALLVLFSLVGRGGDKG